MVWIIEPGESAEDVGGPRREFFRLGISAAISDPSLFTGADHSRAVVHSTTICVKQHYKYVGNLISMSLAQGGSSGHHKATYRFM